MIVAKFNDDKSKECLLAFDEIYLKERWTYDQVSILFAELKKLHKYFFPV